MNTTFIAALAAFGILAASGRAQAHAFLASAAPAVGSTVSPAPAEVAIHFTEEVEPAFSTIAVTDGAGHAVTSGAPHTEANAAILAVALRPLPPGTYAVEWHATSVDTHRTQGRFRFTVR